jgi:hypothetical protein
MLEKELRETFTWTAFYSDGTTLEQYGSNKTSNYADIDRKNLAAFGILKNNELIYRVFVEPNQNLIYRRRPKGNFQTGEVTSELILVGTKEKVNGVDVQNIAYIDVTTGFIQVAGKWVGGEPTLRSDEIGQ